MALVVILTVIASLFFHAIWKRFWLTCVVSSGAALAVLKFMWGYHFPQFGSSDYFKIMGVFIPLSLVVSVVIGLIVRGFKQGQSNEKKV